MGQVRPEALDLRPPVHLCIYMYICNAWVCHDATAVSGRFETILSTIPNWTASSAVIK